MCWLRPSRGVAGSGPGAHADLARIVSAIPAGETVVIDGLIASAKPPRNCCPTRAGYE